MNWTPIIWSCWASLREDGTDGAMDGEETGTQHGDGTESGIEMEMKDIEETDGQQRGLVWK